MYLIVWEFTVAPEHRAEFVRRYASDGDWARLFARSSEFQGTQLIADESEPTRFLTIDRWSAPGGWERFKAAHGADYAGLDQRCTLLTRAERRLIGGLAT